MDEAKIREIVRDELGRRRARGPMGGALAAKLREVVRSDALEVGPVTTLRILALAGVQRPTRGDQTVAGAVLRAEGWAPRRKGAGARERVYERTTAQAA